jgi:hypothetical protein
MARGRFDVSIQISDSITISSTLVSVSGPIGSSAVMTLLPSSQFVAPTFQALASDSNGSSGVGQGLAYNGLQYGTISESVSTPATVTALSSVGSIALVTALLRSGLSVQVPANACFSANQGGAGPSAQ